MVSKSPDNARTTSGQNRAEDARTDGQDIPLRMSCPSGDRPDVREALSNLDRVAKEMEIAWGDVLLPSVGDEWRSRFEGQLSRLNEAIDAGDDDRILNAANAMRRAWLKVDLVARENGIRPAADTVWVVEHPRMGNCAVYNAMASLGHIPQDMARFHIEEIVKLIPDAVFKIKGYWPEAEITDVRRKQMEELNDEIPF